MKRGKGVRARQVVPVGAFRGRYSSREGELVFHLLEDVACTLRRRWGAAAQFWRGGTVQRRNARQCFRHAFHCRQATSKHAAKKTEAGGRWQVHRGMAPTAAEGGEGQAAGWQHVKVVCGKQAQNAQQQEPEPAQCTGSQCCSAALRVQPVQVCVERRHSALPTNGAVVVVKVRRREKVVATRPEAGIWYVQEAQRMRSRQGQQGSQQGRYRYVKPMQWGETGTGMDAGIGMVLGQEGMLVAANRRRWF